MVALAPLHRRRKSSRRMARLDCSAIRMSDFRHVGDSLLDLSQDGALLRTDDSLAIGDELLLSFHVPGEGEQSFIDAPATVVRIVRGEREGDRGRGVGLRFRNLHPTETRRIGDGISSIPPVIPGRRRPVDYAATVRSIDDAIAV